MLPLNYILTKNYDIVGTASAGLISMTIYNLIRIIFLWSKFNLLPFTGKTVYTILFAAVCFGICYILFRHLHGFPGLVLRSVFFCILYGSGVIYLNLSPDVIPVWNTIKRRIGLSK